MKIKSLLIIAIFIYVFGTLTPINFSYALNTNTPKETIIDNNIPINHYEKLQQINNEIIEDNINYTFNKDSINNDITNFKITFINTINNFISNKDYTGALAHLNTYFYLYQEDTQINEIKEFLLTQINQKKLTQYSGNIEVLSFKPLISHPEYVLTNKNSTSIKLDENHITTDEFIKILINLYEKNYILISPNQLINNNNTQITKTDLLLPPNKKPLILILEDTYYNSKQNGSVDKLIINKQEQISTYTAKRAINERISTNNDFITILNNFVNEHPSFSLNNAKATIVVDGNKGIFGYNTQKTNATSKYEIKKAKKITNQLKEIGYDFASSGYNYNITDSSVDFANGLNIWKNNITKIVGNTNIFFLNTNYNNLINNHRDKINTLKQYEFNIFIGVEVESKYNYLSDLNGYYITTKQVNGKTLRYSKEGFSHLFDCEKIYDHINRTITFNN